MVAPIKRQSVGSGNRDNKVHGPIRSRFKAQEVGDEPVAASFHAGAHPISVVRPAPDRHVLAPRVVFAKSLRQVAHCCGELAIGTAELLNRHACRLWIWS